MKYLILSGQYVGSVRDFGIMDESAQRKRKLFAIENYESYKALDEVGKAVYLASAQAERGIEVSELDKKVVARAATSQVEKESKEKGITKSDTMDLPTAEETINIESTESVETAVVEESDTIETINTEEAEELTNAANTEDIQGLRAEYLAKTGSKVPPRFSNNADWIKTKL